MSLAWHQYSNDSTLVGEAGIDLRLSGIPTSEPRVTPKGLVVEFGVDVRPRSGGDVVPGSVDVQSEGGIRLPRYDSCFLPPYDVCLLNRSEVGRRVLITFAEPVHDQARIHVSFDTGLEAADGQALGDADFELRYLQGDADGDGLVTNGDDVSYVEERFGYTDGTLDASRRGVWRADVNQSGLVDQEDVDFIRQRADRSAP